MNHRLKRVGLLLRRVVKRARTDARLERCPYCGNDVPVVGLRTKFDVCGDRECRDRHYWKVHFGVTDFPEVIPTGPKERRAMRRILLDHD